MFVWYSLSASSPRRRPGSTAAQQLENDHVPHGLIAACGAMAPAFAGVTALE